MEKFRQVQLERESLEVSIELLRLRRICERYGAGDIVNRAVKNWLSQFFPFGTGIDPDVEDEAIETLADVLDISTKRIIEPPLSIFIDALLTEIYHLEDKNVWAALRAAFIMGTVFSEFSGKVDTEENKRGYQ